jgi:4-amino-4-deoxy-L-arabinose transferase-like glycosyltransferase
MRFRPSSHARVSASVPAVRDEPARAEEAAPPPPLVDAESRGGEPRKRSRLVIVVVLLGLIVVTGLVLRLRNNGYGLPYVYNFDESSHFVSRSVNVFGGELDPRYYQNPSGYTYLVFLALKLWYGVFGVHLHYGTVAQQFFVDPTPIWQFTRTFTALIAMAGVLATFVVARRWWGVRVALVAAALLTFAFLPVVYSRIAVTDVATFFPVAGALYASFRVLDDGRLRWYLLGGAAVGLATGFKYTAGLVLLPLLIAAVTRFLRDRGTPLWRRRDVYWGVGAAVVAVLCFAATTPYFFVHWSDAISQLREQAVAAGQIEKLGQSQQGGFSYYFHSLGWGFGWAALVAAAAGAVIQLRRDLVRGVMLVSFPVVLYLYMSTQTRYFGRWLLMMYPVLALLGAIAVVHVCSWLAARLGGRTAGRRWGWAVPGVLAGVLTALILIQPVAADWRTSEILGRADTRQLARDWLVSHFPQSLRIVIEPAVQTDYFLKPPDQRDGGRQFVQGFVRDLRRQQKIDAPLGADTTYAATLTPGNIDAYRSAGFCLVMTNSLTRGRAENAHVPKALAYYQRLERESDHILHLSPFKPGRAPVPLHFDFSYDYYPTAYYRPGGIVDVYRLHNCTQKTGRVVQHPYGTSGLRKGVGTAYAPPGATAGSGEPAPAQAPRSHP